jgi:hypothetical protein
MSRVSFPIEAADAGEVTLTALSENGQVSRTAAFPAGRSAIRQRLRLRGRQLRLRVEAAGTAAFCLPDGVDIEIEEESP